MKVEGLVRLQSTELNLGNQVRVKFFQGGRDRKVKVRIDGMRTLKSGTIDYLVTDSAGYSFWVRFHTVY